MKYLEYLPDVFFGLKDGTVAPNFSQISLYFLLSVTTKISSNNFDCLASLIV